jgi:hypothetical protein
MRFVSQAGVAPVLFSSHMVTGIIISVSLFVGMEQERPIKDRTYHLLKSLILLFIGRSGTAH